MTDKLKPVVGRYAPSPTGLLHLGNLRTALLCWLQARLAGGEMLLRIDDLDAPRNKTGSLQKILEDLQWLGLEWDRDIIFQSARSEIYMDSFNILLEQGDLFPCRCSRRDIELALSAPDSRTADGAYPGTCRAENTPAAFASDELLAWRFRVDDELVCFDDQIAGSQSEDLAANPGDFIVRRKDGIFAYQLASVVDDIQLGVTDIVRGADLLDSTARQIALFTALDSTVPRFWHVPLMIDPDGEKLSKRGDAESLQSFRERHPTPAAVVGILAASLGLIDSAAPISADELLQQLSASGFHETLIHAAH